MKRGYVLIPWWAFLRDGWFTIFFAVLSSGDLLAFEILGTENPPAAHTSKLGLTSLNGVRGSVMRWLQSLQPRVRPVVTGVSMMGHGLVHPLAREFPRACWKWRAVLRTIPYPSMAFHHLRTDLSKHNFLLQVHLNIYNLVI